MNNLIQTGVKLSLSLEYILKKRPCGTKFIYFCRNTKNYHSSMPNCQEGTIPCGSSEMSGFEWPNYQKLSSSLGCIFADEN